MAEFKVIIDFDMIFDVDVGMIDYLRDTDMINAENDGKRIFRNEYAVCTKDQMIKHLSERKNINPIAEVISVDFIENAPSLYAQLMEDSYKDLLDKAVVTDMFNFVMTSLKVGSMISITIRCDNDDQVALVRTFEELADVKTLVSTWEEVDISTYGNAYIKNYSDTLKIKNLNGKNIYIPDLGYNKETVAVGLDVPLQYVSAIVAISNSVSVISLYNRLNKEEITNVEED